MAKEHRDDLRLGEGRIIERTQAYNANSQFRRGRTYTSSNRSSVTQPSLSVDCLELKLYAPALNGVSGSLQGCQLKGVVS